jgi:transcriptional regulator with XRE-family HTH domain
MKIGEAIRRVRREKDFTQQIVAERAGITSGHLSKIESGATDPDSEMIVRIADALGTNAATLFSILTKSDVPVSRDDTPRGTAFSLDFTHSEWDSEADRKRFFDIIEELKKVDPADAGTVRDIIKRYRKE